MFIGSNNPIRINRYASDLYECIADSFISKKENDYDSSSTVQAKIAKYFSEYSIENSVTKTDTLVNRVGIVLLKEKVNQNLSSKTEKVNEYKKSFKNTHCSLTNIQNIYNQLDNKNTTCKKELDAYNNKKPIEFILENKFTSKTENIIGPSKLLHTAPIVNIEQTSSTTTELENTVTTKQLDNSKYASMFFNNLDLRLKSADKEYYNIECITSKFIYFKTKKKRWTRL